MAESEEVTGTITVKADDDASTQDKGKQAADPTVTDVDDLLDDSPDGTDKGKSDSKQKESKTKSETEADEAEKQKAAEAERAKQEKAELDYLRKKKRELETALHKERQKKKADSAKPDDDLTDEQLAQIMRDNPDEETRLRVSRYIAQREAKKAKADAMTEVDTVRKQQLMASYLQKQYPALYEEGSEMRQEVEQAKAALGITNHPFADYFATGVKVMENLPTIMKEAYEKGKADALAGKADEKRKDRIKDESLADKGKSGGGKSGKEGLSGSEASTAKQMGFKGRQLEIYKQLTGKNARIVSVED